MASRGCLEASIRRPRGVGGRSVAIGWGILQDAQSSKSPGGGAEPAAQCFRNLPEPPLALHALAHGGHGQERGPRDRRGASEVQFALHSQGLAVLELLAQDLVVPHPRRSDLVGNGDLVGTVHEDVQLAAEPLVGLHHIAPLVAPIPALSLGGRRIRENSRNKSSRATKGQYKGPRCGNPLPNPHAPPPHPQKHPNNAVGPPAAISC